MKRALICILFGAALAGGLPAALAAPEPFEAVPLTDKGGERHAARIVLAEGVAPAGWDWEALRRAPSKTTAADPLYSALLYLQEGLQRMTGALPEVAISGDLSRGIVLVTDATAPPELRDDPEVKEALASRSRDGFDANEAFFIRTEKERTLIVANRVEGLTHGVTALLESIGYEVLGMGPNWTHVPDFHERPLVFRLEVAERPGFYIRFLAPTTAQNRGVGTLSGVTLTDPADEPVQESYRRWQVGTRQMGGWSMPRIRGGHALGHYHRPVAMAMRDENKTEGFLFKHVIIGEASERPAASPENEGTFWINRGEAGSRPDCYLSNGKEWEPRNLVSRLAGASLDLTSELTRRVILEQFKARAEEAFAAAPDEPFHFSTDPEDGSPQFARIREMVKNPEWYPAWLEERGRSFGSYRLHGFKGIDQPTEKWDGNSPSDIVYGFNNWLLWEYDRYIDSLPPEQQVTATGKSKKASVYCNLLSYNYHDVPPHFNLDPRIRIKIAGFPKNRGRGMWASLVTSSDMAAAYRVLLPDVPSVVYEIWSQAYFHDTSAGNITGSPSAAEIAQKVHRDYEVGIRGFETETDFNFGKFGLRYYLTTKMLWNPSLSATELDAIRDQWLQRSFGAGWNEMKAYYDFMVPNDSRINSPHRWAQATRMIDAAWQKAHEAGEVDAVRRLDDLKQFWYFYYLVESGQTAADSPALREFLWKGQSSYMTAMVMVAKRFFNGKHQLAKILDESLTAGPAHYSAGETAAWWKKVLDFWPQQQVAEFSDALLADGTRGSEVDLNDLVAIPAFSSDNATGTTGNLIVYNYNPGKLLMKQDARFFSTAREAGEEIGFKLAWPEQVAGRSTLNIARHVPYGISWWDAAAKEWHQEVDFTQTEVPSNPVVKGDGTKWFVAEGRFNAPRPGTYRVDVGGGGITSRLTSLDYDLESDSAKGAGGQTYAIPLSVSRGGPLPWYFYIPRGTRQLHFEMASGSTANLVLYKGTPGRDGTWASTRRIRIQQGGVNRIELKEGEDGSVAVFETATLPYLYSIPMLFAKTPSALLLPRAVARADGLLQ